MAPLALQQASRLSSSRSIAPVSRPSLVRSRGSSVAVRAAQLPAGVSRPTKAPETPEPKFGFVYNAERLNSRACMLGFMGTLIIEALSHKGVLEMAGLTVGQGLGFEF